MITTNLTIATQLPIVESQLREASAKVDARVQEAMALVCTEETVKTIKEVRASMNKELKEFEDKRKQIKSEIMKPYEDFEKIYKEKIADKYKSADSELKNKIDSVENELKEKKKQEVVDYFNEYSKSKNIDFVTFEQAKINITLSASMKSLKEQVATFIDKVANDLLTISLQTDEIEILVEYKKTLDVNQAIQTVTERKKAIQYETQTEQMETEKVIRGLEVDKAWMDEPMKPSMSDFVMQASMKTAVIKLNATNLEIAQIVNYLKEMKIKYEVEVYEHI